MNQQGLLYVTLRELTCIVRWCRFGCPRLLFLAFLFCVTFASAQCLFAYKDPITKCILVFTVCGLLIYVISNVYSGLSFYEQYGTG